MSSVRECGENEIDDRGTDWPSLTSGMPSRTCANRPRKGYARGQGSFGSCQDIPCQVRQVYPKSQQRRIWRMA